MAFNVDVTGIDAGHALWLDLAEFDANGNLVQNAPFSHAAQGGQGGSVPDAGSTAMLLGLGMLGLGLAKRKLFC
jgi:hypothetical protein